MFARTHFRDHVRLDAGLLARLTHGIAPGPVLVAVSGGVDSVALLDLLFRTRDVHGLELVVGHVDHGIHPDSGAVAEQVARLAAELGVACHVEAAGLGPDAGETGEPRPTEDE